MGAGVQTLTEEMTVHVINMAGTLGLTPSQPVPKP